VILTFGPWCPSHVCYLSANFGLPRPLCSRLRPDVRDRQKDVRDRRRETASSLNALPIRGGDIIRMTEQKTVQRNSSTRDTDLVVTLRQSIFQLLILLRVVDRVGRLRLVGVRDGRRLLIHTPLTTSHSAVS